MKWILHFIILWSFILSSYTVFSAPLFHKCMGILSKIRKKRNNASEQLSAQDRLKQLNSTYVSLTIQDAREYDKAITKLAQLERRLQNTFDPFKQEALKIQIREFEKKVDELLQRNRNNIDTRTREIDEYNQAITKLNQLEEKLQNTSDSSRQEALKIQIREIKNKMDELLERNHNNIETRTRKIREFEQKTQEEVQ